MLYQLFNGSGSRNCCLHQLRKEVYCSFLSSAALMATDEGDFDFQWAAYRLFNGSGSRNCYLHRLALRWIVLHSPPPPSPTPCQPPNPIPRPTSPYQCCVRNCCLHLWCLNESWYTPPPPPQSSNFPPPPPPFFFFFFFCLVSNLLSVCSIFRVLGQYQSNNVTMCVISVAILKQVFRRCF